MSKRIAGFTLIELIVTLVLAAIVLTVAVPSFQDSIRNNRRATQANDLISALNLARSEAITRAQLVTICRSSNQASCAAGANWEDGWIVFVDSNTAAGDTTGVLDASEEPPLRVYRGLSGGNTLRVNTNFTNYFSYKADGQSRGSNGSALGGKLSLCDDQGATEARYVTINSTGRMQVRDYQAGDSCP